MERGEYERLAAVEERGWWFQGLHANLRDGWRRATHATRAPRVLDAGCGTGGLLAALHRAEPDCRRFGLELDPFAAALAREKSDAAIAVGSILAPPFAAAMDTIFSADVLCHRGVEPQAALDALAACLKPGGLLVLNLPAYRWLLSGHDHAVDNVRRFGRNELRELVAQAGLQPVAVYYWNSILFPLMLAQRLLHRRAASDVALLPAPLEALFRAAVRFESWLGARGLRLPFGGSILVLAVKP